MGGRRRFESKSLKKGNLGDFRKNFKKGNLGDFSEKFKKGNGKEG